MFLAISTNHSIPQASHKLLAGSNCHQYFFFHRYLGVSKHGALLPESQLATSFQTLKVLLKKPKMLVEQYKSANLYLDGKMVGLKTTTGMGR